MATTKKTTDNNKSATMDVSQTKEAQAAAAPAEAPVKTTLTQAEIEALGTPKPKKPVEAGDDEELTKPKPLTADQLAVKVGGTVERVDGRTVVRDVVAHKSGPILRHTFMDTKKA